MPDFVSREYFVVLYLGRVKQAGLRQLLGASEPDPPRRLYSPSEDRVISSRAVQKIPLPIYDPET